MACEILVIPYAEKMMSQYGLGADDTSLMKAVIKNEPFRGRMILPACSSLRLLPYCCIENNKMFDVFYVYFANSDIQLGTNDIAIIIGLDCANSTSGTHLEPEGILRLVELIGELARHVMS